MPPKGSKKSAAAKKVNGVLKKAAMKPDTTVTFDANGRVVGSKEANWALLKEKNSLYSFLDGEDVMEAVELGVVLGSNDWVKSKTARLQSAHAAQTRHLSASTEWEFPAPQMAEPRPRTKSSRKRNAPEHAGQSAASKRQRRGTVMPPPPPRFEAGAEAEVEVEAEETTEVNDSSAASPSLSFLDLPEKAPRMSTFGGHSCVLDKSPSPSDLAGEKTVGVVRGSLAAAAAAAASSSAAAAVAPPRRGRGRPKGVAKARGAAPLVVVGGGVSNSTFSSALSSLASRTPSLPSVSEDGDADWDGDGEARGVEEQEEEEDQPTTTSTTTKSPLPPPQPQPQPTTPGRKPSRAAAPGGPSASASGAAAAANLACRHCARLFGRVEHLDRHVKSVHDRVREFECRGCRARFSRKDNMRQHMRKCAGLVQGEGERG